MHCLYAAIQYCIYPLYSKLLFLRKRNKPIIKYCIISAWNFIQQYIKHSYIIPYIFFLIRASKAFLIAFRIKQKHVLYCISALLGRFLDVFYRKFIQVCFLCIKVFDYIIQSSTHIRHNI